MVSAISIITDGFGLDWDPVKDSAPPILLPSARAESACVSVAVFPGGAGGDDRHYAGACAQRPDLRAGPGSGS